MESRLASAAFIVVFAIYLFLGGMGLTERNIPSPREDAYNSLARGLLSGHLYAAKEVPPGLAALPDPYDPKANEVYRSDVDYMDHDYSYYQGHMYLYFGVAPALFVFIPWHVLTGTWLPQWMAVALLCAGGLLANLSLVRAVMREVFPAAPKWMLAACVFILGLGSYAPLLLARADMWEVPIAFSYLGVSLALRFLWSAFGRPEKPGLWIALASLSIGLAFAARPSVLPVGAVLLLPFALPATRKSLGAWAAAVVPLGLSGLAVAVYNQLRFGGAFEFGQRYQLASEHVSKMKLFSAEYLGTNLYLFLLKAVDWRPYFPYASEPKYSSVGANHGMVEHLSGALLNDPVLWAALALGIFLFVRRPGTRLALLVTAAGWAFLSSLLLMSLFFGICSRYQFEFLPPLALLAALGVIALESLLSGQRLVVARIIWIPVLLFSSAFTVLYALDRSVEDHSVAAIILTSKGNLRDAEHEVQILKFLAPTDPLIQVASGVILMAGGHLVGAEHVFTRVARDYPDYALGHYDLGRVLLSEGRATDAVAELRQAQQLAPDSPTIGAVLKSAEAKAAQGGAH
jgi:hypothetical protein